RSELTEGLHDAKAVDLRKRDIGNKHKRRAVTRHDVHGFTAVPCHDRLEMQLLKRLAIRKRARKIPVRNYCVGRQDRRCRSAAPGHIVNGHPSWGNSPARYMPTAQQYLVPTFLRVVVTPTTSTLM